ncbi:hypothetical protein OSTOST_00440 [Ostertagia ostertagi]
MKLYIFDDTVLISGANLSDNYFVNRQDRYVVFENKELADFFHNIVTAVGECSFLLNCDGSTKLHPNCLVHPYEGLPVFLRCLKLGVFYSPLICYLFEISAGSFIDFHDMLKERVNSVVGELQNKDRSSSTRLKTLYCIPFYKWAYSDIMKNTNYWKSFFLPRTPICA